MELRLPEALERDLRSAAVDWQRIDGTKRLFDGDPSLWTGGKEGSWLGWLAAPAEARRKLDLWSRLAEEAREFDHVLLLGMGGSSLGADVQRRVLGRHSGFPEVHVLDSTSPDQIRDLQARVELARTLFVVSSKSGTTLEPNLLMHHFLGVVEEAVGESEAPRRFLAITDPGSALEKLAGERGFRRVVAGEPSVGGRFSVLTPFGLVPGALQGMDLDRWLASAGRMEEKCRVADPLDNPGVSLGLLLGAAVARGQDKLTLITAPGIDALGAWLEQLVAESTGKQGKAILPFAGEGLGEPGVYGEDRLFVAVSLGGRMAPGDEARLARLAEVGHPVIRLDVPGPEELAGEFFRWELATAVAGSRMGIDPFDQPDVEAAKVEARRLTDAIEATGGLPPEEAFFEQDGLRWITSESQARVLRAGAGPRPSAGALLRAHLSRMGRGDYFALLAFLSMSEPHVDRLERLRRRVRDAHGVATALGFGPRFLHSTGQAFKGGPASGVFLQLSGDPAHDLPVRGQRLTFGQVQTAQARGDFAVLLERGRRALRIHLSGDVEAGLETLEVAFDEALAG